MASHVLEDCQVHETTQCKDLVWIDSKLTCQEGCRNMSKVLLTHMRKGESVIDLAIETEAFDLIETEAFDLYTLATLLHTEYFQSLLPACPRSCMRWIAH